MELTLKYYYPKAEHSELGILHDKKNILNSNSDEKRFLQVFLSFPLFTYIVLFDRKLFEGRLSFLYGFKGVGKLSKVY